MKREGGGGFGGRELGPLVPPPAAISRGTSGKSCAFRSTADVTIFQSEPPVDCCPHDSRKSPPFWLRLCRVGNCLIILVSDAGDTIASTAKQVGCRDFTVKRVRLHRTGGINAPRPINPPGRPCRVTAAYLAAMKRAVRTNSLDLGYGFLIWSAARLAAHLAKVIEIQFSADQMRRLLYQEGYSVHRTKHTVKGKRDEVAYAKAKKQLRRLEKSPEEGLPKGSRLPRRCRDSPASDAVAE